MKIEELEIRERGPGIGLALYWKDKYMATYMSMNDCVTDMIYHFGLSDFEGIKRKFLSAQKIEKPYKYRGICSEYFYPTESLQSYVCYGNTLSDIIATFETHERRAIKWREHFEYGVQGTGIHIFNKETGTYDFWTGGNIKSVADIIRNAKKENKIIPDEVVEEFSKIDQVDVFISHKSEDVLIAKKIYDFLINNGYHVFLSEMSLPALANADYSAEIDKALDKATNIIVVADSLDKIESGWVKYEWSSFANEKRSGRKSGNIITVVTENMNVESLPYLLRQHEVISFADIEKIVAYI
jgi:hypothetical protein